MQWRDEHEANPNIATFDVWVTNALHNHPHDPNNIDDIGRIFLCSRPSQNQHGTRGCGHLETIFDQKIRNLHCCKHTTVELFSYLICLLQILNPNYMGVLQDILKLDNCPLQTLINFFSKRMVQKGRQLRKSNVCAR